MAGQNRGKDEVRLKTRLVLIDALVKEKRTAAPLDDLLSTNFQVLDEGKQRTVTHFSIGEKRQPLALVLLFDLSNKGAGRFFHQLDIPKSLDAALSKLSPKDEVAVIAMTGEGFNTRQRELTGFTNDRKKIRDGLVKLPELIDPDFLGVFFFADLISEIARVARLQRPNSHIVVIYVSESLILAGPAERRRGTEALLRENVTFSALLCKPTKSVTARSVPFMPLFTAFGISTKGADYLSKQTGGVAVSVNKPEEYRAGLEAIMGDLFSRYTLGFELDANEPDDGRLHRLEVKVKAADKSGKPRKLEVIARRGYFLPKPQQPVAQKAIEPEASRITTDQPKRETDQEAIKQSVYDLHYSVMTGDIDGVKRLTAKRTLDLTRLFFDLLIKNISNRDGGQDMPASSGDELFRLMFGLIAENSKRTVSAEQIRDRARAKSECRITFTGDRTASIEYSDGTSARAVFEDDRWKIDDTEKLKEQLLRMDLFTAEQKEQIKKY